MRRTWRQRIGKRLRDWAARIDPKGVPGRRRKACAHLRVNPNCGTDYCSPMCIDCGALLPFEVVDPLLHGWAEEPRA